MAAGPATPATFLLEFQSCLSPSEVKAYPSELNNLPLPSEFQSCLSPSEVKDRR